MPDSTATVSVMLPQWLLSETGPTRDAAGQALLQVFVSSLYRRDQ
jgi:hypothetical protein